MTDVHLRKHEAVRDCGSFEVWFDDGRPSKFSYFDDLPNRTRRPDIMTKAQAADAAQAFARAERDRIGDLLEFPGTGKRDAAMHSFVLEPS
jgi:hypothetical protein